MSATLMAAPYSISQTAITADTVDGKLYAIPESMKAVALFYRTDLLPTAPATTADWMATLKSGTKLGLVYGPNGGGAYYQWGFYGAFGGKILDDSGKCAATATSGVADSLKFLQDFKAAGGILYQNDTDAKTDFLSGKIAGFIDGPWQTGDLKKALGDKLAVVPGPRAGRQLLADDRPGRLLHQRQLRQPDLAIQFALQMLAPENVKTFVDNAGHIPANTVTAATWQRDHVISKGFAAAGRDGLRPPDRQGARQLLEPLR